MSRAARPAAPAMPPNVRRRSRADGSVRLWWEPPARARALALALAPVALDPERPTWSAREAERLNRKVAEALAGGGVRRAGGGRTMAALIADYQGSSIWTDKLKPKTRESYGKNFRLIEAKWGGDRVADFEKSVMWTWYQTLRKSTGPSQAVALMRAMSLLFSHAERIGWRGEGSNPCARLSLSIPRGRRRVASWDEFDRLTAAADRLGLGSVALAAMLSLFAGQRQTDVILAERAEFVQAPDRGRWIWQLVRSKRGNHGAIELHPELVARLQAALDAAGPRQTRLLIDERSGQPYDEGLFQRRWRLVRAAAIADGGASLAGLHFRDLRRTFGVLARAGGASQDDTADVLGNSAARNAWLADVYMAPQLETASRAAEAIRRPVPGDKERKAG